jgi:hypothetical protein
VLSNLATSSGASLPFGAGAFDVGLIIIMISDTTFAATSLGTDLKDKFKINLFIFSS